MVTEKQAKAALARLQKGKTSLIAESRRLGFSHNGPLRKALRLLIGPEAYAELTERACPRKPPPPPRQLTPPPLPPRQLTTTRDRLLDLIAKHPEMKQCELAAALGIKAATVAYHWKRIR